MNTVFIQIRYVGEKNILNQFHSKFLPEVGDFITINKIPHKILYRIWQTSREPQPPLLLVIEKTGSEIL